jgi:histidinol-phosphate aminotransferase
VVEAIARAARVSNRYPDMFGDDLAGMLAEHHGLPADRVAAAGGSLVLLQQAVQAIASPGDEVLFGWRSYEAYPIIVQVARCLSVTVPLSQHRLDMQQLAEHITDATRIVILCSPNNPTSTDVSSESLEAFLEVLPSNCLVILDEAYREFSTGKSVPDGLSLQERFDNLLVLRTFSKAHNLAGARIGWCAGDPEIVRALRRVALPFTLSRLACAAAAAAIAEDPATVSSRVAAIVAERERLSGRLREIGFEVPASEANFVWLPLGNRSDSFALCCARMAVSVRGFSGEGVRITVGTPTANDLVIDAGESFASER